MRRIAVIVCLSVLSVGVMCGQDTHPVGKVVKNAPQTPNQLTQGTKNLEPAGLDSVMQELYGTISGPAGMVRNPDRFRNLFIKDKGRLTNVGKDPKTGEVVVRLITPEDYIQNSFPKLEKNGFFESEVARRTERFGNILQVWSTYESRRTPDGQPFARGINGLQLVNDGSGWKILSIFWEAERPDNPIPQQYLEMK